MGKKINYTKGDKIGLDGCIYLEDANNGVRQREAYFKCHCGYTFKCRLSCIKNGSIRSCGCLIRKGKNPSEVISTVKNKIEYSTYCHIKSRTTNPKDHHYHLYGLRGIKMSKEWSDSFKTFFEDMGPRPSGKYSIERLDNNKGYCKENCVWADVKTQANNKRSNVRLTCNGETLTLTQWAKKIDMSYGTIKYRIKKGWSVEEAINTPRLRAKTK